MECEICGNETEDGFDRCSDCLDEWGEVLWPDQ